MLKDNLTLLKKALCLIQELHGDNKLPSYIHLSSSYFGFDSSEDVAAIIDDLVRLKYLARIRRAPPDDDDLLSPEYHFNKYILLEVPNLLKIHQ